jgi:antitoxin component HigA of HigAB toxin-antitoxin module
MTDVKVTNEREYFVAAKRVFELMVDDPAANTPEGEELARLAAAIDEFEGGRYPITCCAFAAKDAVARLAALLRNLGDMYDLAGAIDWCESPQQLLDGQRPIDMVISDVGAAEVDAAVTRLRDGVHV